MSINLASISLLMDAEQSDVDAAFIGIQRDGGMIDLPVDASAEGKPLESTSLSVRDDTG
jgi:hypothetical protein